MEHSQKAEKYRTPLKEEIKKGSLNGALLNTIPGVSPASSNVGDKRLLLLLQEKDNTEFVKSLKQTNLLSSDSILKQEDDTQDSVVLFQNRIEDSTLESLRAFSDGNTSATIESRELGTVIYEIGSTGKHGHGVLHIIEKRMAEGKSLEEATDIAIAVAESVASGDITASIKNTRHLDKGNIRAIVAINGDGNIVVTGYDIINEEENSDANRRSGTYASETHVRSDQMVASFNDRLNQLLEKRNTADQQSAVTEAEATLSEKYRESFAKQGDKYSATEEEERIIKKIVHSYPKHTVADGIQMMDGLLEDNHDMPMQKEYLTARLMRELLGEDLILLPRYMDRRLNRIAGYLRFNNYSLSDGISAVAEGGKTFEFKYISSPDKVVRNLNKAIRKADVGVVIISSPNSIGRIDVSRVISEGEAYIINVYDEDNFEVRHKNTSTKEWRLGHQEPESQHRLENSSHIKSIVSELQKVNPEDQTPMGYATYNASLLINPAGRKDADDSDKGKDKHD